MKNTLLHKLAKDKFGLDESTILNDGVTFTIIGNNGETFTDKDFTKAELDNAQKAFDDQIAAESAQKQTEKAALLTKLGITESEAALLLS
jgi:hypothetical protein